MKKSWGYWLPILLLALLPLTFSSLGMWAMEDHLNYLSEEPREALFWFSLISVFTMGLALTPTTLIAVICGFFFGWQGLWGILVAYPLAAILGRIMGLLWFRLWGNSRLFQQEKYRNFLDRLAIKPFWFLVMARLSPALPFAMTNVLLGQLRISWATYLGATMLGMIPRTLLAFMIGQNISDFWTYIQNPGDQTVEQLVISVLLLVSSLALWFILKKVWRKV